MKTAFLMTLLTLLLVMVGDAAGGRQGMMVMLIFSLGMNFMAYWNSDKMVLAQYRARQVDENSAPGLYGIVKRLAQRANLPMPKVYIIDDQVPNAFATGRNPEHAAVAVTTALMNYLSPKEIEGVLGHELTHVKNRDILISTVAASLAGVITTISRFALWFGGGRDRENSNPIAAVLMLVLAPIAAALINAGITSFRYTQRNHEKRGIFCAIGRCTDCMMIVDGIPNTRTCVTPVRDGMQVQTQYGLGPMSKKGEEH